MRKKLTLLISMLFLSLGMAWAQTATLEVSTNVAYPEYQYRIKNANGIWMASRTEPTQNNIASFAFFVAGTDFYKIYSIDKGQWVSYDKSNGSDNCKDFVKFANSQDAANAWKITTTTRSNQKVYQIQPQNNDGSVSNRYMNWNAGVGDGGGYGYSYDDTKTVGLWRDNATADGGSAWILVDNTESVSEVADFENGAIYTFVTARGWMGSNTTANVISSAYGGNNIPAADVKRTNPNFQWTVYKSANNKYYLYNIGKGQFMGMQTANNAAIPFAETPAGLKMTFKKSGNANYPIMFSIDNVGVVNHSTDRSYGLIYWNGGWSNPNDEGSNHKVVKVGELDDATLSAIEARVAQYEETAILKMPEAGKYYRIMAVEGWNDDARYLGSKNYQGMTRAEYVANADAYTIFHFDGNYLKSYASGHYLVSNSSFLGYNGEQATGSKIGFQEDPYVAGVYNISFNDGNRNRWLFVHQNNYTDAGTNADNSNGYRFNIVEVTELPVAQIGNTVYNTIAEAVKAVKAGETLTLFVNTDETFVLPLGAVLDKNGHTADNVTVAQPVAKVGDAEYASLAAAISAASAGQTITLVADITESVTITKNLTIDGAGKQYTGTMTANKGLTVTVENVAFVNGGFDKPKAQNSTTGTYTLKNCTFDGAGTYAYPVRVYGVNKLNIENCTVKNYQYSFLYVVKSALNINVKNVTVEGCPNYAVYFASGVTNAMIEGLKVKNSTSGILCNNSTGRYFTMKGCSFENVTTPIEHNGGTSTITCTALGVNELGTTNMSQYVKIVADAKIGTTVYETLEAAFAAAQSGETVTLLNNVTLPASAANGAFEIAAGKTLTLDLNGKNITAGAREGYTGRTQYAFDNRADLTITGAGTITSRGIQNYGTLTINSADVKLVACDADGGACVWGYANSVTNIAAGTFENIAGNSALVNTAGKLNVTGGTFTQKGQGATYAIICKGDEATFENATIAGIHGVIAAEGNAKVTINSGAYTLVGVTGQSDHCVYAAENASVAINGGTFTCQDHDAGGKTLYLDGTTASFAVSGGVFDEAVAENLCAEGFVPATEQNADGTYGVEEQVSGHVAYRADVTDKEDREGIAILLKDVLAKKSLVVKVYNDETLMFTCSRREIDDEGKEMFPVNHANTAANIVLWGKESGSWINEIHVAPTVFNVPNKVEIYADGKLTETYTHESGTILGTNLDKYLALECVKKAVAKVGETQYLTLKEAIAGATAGQIVTLIGDAEESKTLVIGKSLTIDGAGHTFAGAIEFNKSSGTYTIKNVKFNGAGTRTYALKTTSSTTKLTVEECTATGYTYGFLHANKTATDVIVKNVTVNDVNYGVHSVYGTNVTLENYKAINTANAVYVQNYGTRNVVLVNCTFEGCEKPLGVWERNQTNKITFNFKGVNEMGKAEFCTSAMAKIVAGAQAGTKVYEDATAAIAAIPNMKAGETFTLYKDVAASEIITLDKAITFNGNGKTLTSTAARAINVDAEGCVAINNLTVNAGERAINIINKPATVELTGVKAIANNNAVMIATSAGAAKVTIDGCDFTGLAVVNVAGAGSNVGIKNSTITNVDANEKENYGAITVWTSADNAVVNVDDKTTITVADDSKKAYVFPASATVTGVDEVGYIVATVGDAGFDTLAEAVEYAQVGGTINIVRDITVANPVTITKSITLDGNNKTLTYTGSNRAIEMPNDAEKALNVTIKNLKVAFSGSYSQRGINYNDNGALTLENVTVNAEGKNVTYALNLPGSSDNATVTIINSSLTGNIALNVWGENAKVDATDSHFTSVDNATHEGYSAIALNNDGSTVANGTIVNINGGTITAKDENGNPSNAVRNATATGKVNVSTTTAVVGSIVNPVAIVDYGTDQFYSCATLQAAIDKAIATNGTVKLIADATGAGAVINGSVTIDFAGHTYSFNEGVGSTGTPSNGLQILKGNTVVLKNGTLNVAAEAADKFYILVQNYANLTVEDMTLDGTNLDKWSKTDGDSYVLSNNCGAVNVIASTIIANNDGEKAFALDACKKDSYEAPVVNVDAESSINGNAEVSATFNVAGTLNGTIVINEKNGVVTGAADLNVTTTVENTKVVYADGKYALVAVVAKIGETAFASLAEAITAAKAGETITLIADVTGDVTIDKALTFEGQDKTYTGAMILKADATFNNVHFDGKGFNGYAITTRGANYLTINGGSAMNYGYGFVQLASGTELTTIKDVKVSNMNYGVKVDYSNAVVLENVDITAGVAALLNSNFGEKTITIKDSKLNILGTWKRNDTKKTTYVFDGANTVGEFITEAAIDNFKLTAGATLTAPADQNVTTDEADYKVIYQDGTYMAVADKVTIVDGDGKDFVNNTEYVVGTLTYKRELYDDLLWNALFVPFEIPVSTLTALGLEVVYFNDVHSYDDDNNGTIDRMTMESIKLTSGTLQANHPYMFRRTSNDASTDLNLTLYDAKLYSSNEESLTTVGCSSAYTEFEIGGTYKQMSFDDLNGRLIINEDGNWKPMGEEYTLNPFRLHLTITQKNGSPVKIEKSAMRAISIRVIGEGNGSTTDIKYYDVDKQDSEAIYDLQGRRVANPVKGGIYIVNGKKVYYSK